MSRWVLCRLRGVPDIILEGTSLDTSDLEVFERMEGGYYEAKDALRKYMPQAEPRKGKSGGKTKK